MRSSNAPAPRAHSRLSLSTFHKKNGTWPFALHHHYVRIWSILLSVTMLMCGCRATTPAGNSLISSSQGKITAILLTERTDCGMLPYYDQWLRAADIHAGILMLTNIASYRSIDSAYICDITAMGIDTFAYTYTPPAKANRPKDQASLHIVEQKVTLPRNEQADPAADQAVIAAPSVSGARGTLTVSSAFYNYTSLKDNKRYKEIMAHLGIDSVSSPAFDRAARGIEGGDYLLIGHDLIFGRRTYDSIGPDAAIRIRRLYGLHDSIRISFTGVDDASRDSKLYHLDLYMAYGGRSPVDHRHRFFVGYMSQIDTADKMALYMKAQLDRFRDTIFPTFLHGLYGADYQIVPVPMIKCMGYIISPLNGIIDYVRDTPRYYMPEPVCDDTAHPERCDCALKARINTDSAYQIISAAMGGTQNALKFKVFIDLMLSSGQALHCTMAIIRRED